MRGRDRGAGRPGQGSGQVHRRGALAVWLAVGGLALGLSLAGCGHSPSTLDPRGAGATRVAGLWWLLFWISVVVFVVVVTLVVAALVRARRPGAAPRSGGEALVVVAGIVVPAVVLTGVYLIGLRDMVALGNSPSRSNVTIQVTGHQWWWEVRYPDLGIVSANELHVPAGRRVRVLLTSADVIHSFWAPQLTVKTDTIPGRTNETWLQAAAPGIYPSALRGQCAEYCGLQHAHMAFQVIVEEPAAFDRWVAAARRAAAVPTDPLAAQGRSVFEAGSCAACHSIAGTPARGRVGPDLSHFGSRATLGAGVRPNTPDELARWIEDAQAAKPGNRMPPQPLTPEETRALVAYLESLK